MKKLLAPIMIILLCATCLLSACKSGEYTFTFISVRMKGNGDGTVTAVAQNEFSLTSAKMPITLTLYYCDEYKTDTAEMTVMQTSDGDLKITETTSFDFKLQTEGYYCARIQYTAGGETRYIQSDTIYYDIDGNRK